MDISSRIREIREKKGFSIPDLVKVTGISKQNLYSYEKGQYEPGKEKLALIAKALGVEVSDFYKQGPTSSEKIQPDDGKKLTERDDFSYEMFLEIKSNNEVFRAEIDRLWALVDRLTGATASNPVKAAHSNK